MDDEVPVRVGDGRAHLAEQPEPLKRRQSPVVAEPIDRTAVHVLHHQEGQAVCGDAAVEQPGDVGVIKRRQHLTLAAEAADGVLGHHPTLDDLDRHALLELPIGAPGAKDGAHPA